MTPSLVLLGNLLVDDIVFSDGSSRMGQPGGAIMYGALGAALWGTRVGCVGLVGTDYPAGMLDALARRGVDLAGVHPLGVPGVRTWLLYENRVRRLIHRLGCPTHEQVSPGPEHIPGPWQSASAFHLAPMPFAVQRRVIASLAADTSRFVSVDPHLPITEETLGEWRQVLADADGFFPGEDELLLEGADVDPERVLPRLATGRLRYIVFKRAAGGGVLYDTREDRFHHWLGRVSKIVDPTGAGDAFAAGFISAHLEGHPVDACLDRGVVSASFAIEAVGAAALLEATRTDADARIRRFSAAGAGVTTSCVCAQEITDALAAGRPVVALETTLVTHGLPHPDGVSAARALESEVRQGDAIPATIGILGGAIRVGLTDAELNQLATTPDVVKVNLSNLAATLAAGRPGATTVAATMFAAHTAGIRVFATGGIGGVHRDAGISGDVSADLTALSRVPVAVVCAGAKAILDLPRTVEMLETLGVPVFGMGTNEFPAFYRRSSGLPVDSRMDTIEELASAVRRHFALGLGTGVLIANPIPVSDELPAELYERALGTALAEAERQGVRGRGVTPFLLDRLRALTEGESVRANLALLANNARVAAQLARALA